MDRTAVVADASPLIYLAKAGVFGTAREVFGPLGIPPAVWKETVEAGDANGRPDVASIRSALEQGAVVRLEIRPGQEQAAWALGRKYRLGVGESQAIVLAKRADTLLVDDEKARRVAMFLGIDAVPTILLPVFGVRQKVLDRADALALLDQLGRFMAIPARLLLELRANIEEVES